MPCGRLTSQPAAASRRSCWSAGPWPWWPKRAATSFCLATRHGKPFYLNRAGRQLVGLEEKSELSSSLHDYHSDASWERLRDEAVPAVNRCGRWEGECQLRHRKTGALVEVHTTILLVRDPATGKSGSLAIVHRLSGKQREEALAEALAESEARKHAILESALDPIVTIDHEGVITEFNRAAESVFGHPRTTVLGTRPAEVLFPPPSMAGQQVRIDRYLEAGEGSMLGKRAEVTAVRAGGEAFPAEMAMTLSYEHGKPLMTFFIRDISDRKRAEEEQARYAADLERSNHELEQFAYVASHDLQEPLRKIRTFGDRLATSCAAALDPTGRECLERMQTAAERMQSLIQGLLTLSRVTTKGQEFVPVDLAAVAAEVVSDLEVQIQQVQGRVELGRLPSIMADPLQIRQLLQNLIGNALKFRREDEPPVVRVHARFVGDREGRARATRWPASSAGWWSRTTASALKRSMPSGSSEFSNDCTPGRRIPARGSAWPFARRSPNATAARSPPRARRARARSSRSCCRPSTASRRVEPWTHCPNPSRSSWPTTTRRIVCWFGMR